MLTYAVPDDLADHMADIPDDADILIRYASLLVRDATRFDIYDTTPAGAPDDPWIIDAFKDATCVQAAMWASNGINPAGGSAGVEGGIDSSSIAGGSVRYDTSHVDEARASVDTLCPAALAVLRAEGLASRGIVT